MSIPINSKGFAIYFDHVYPITVLGKSSAAGYLDVKFGAPLYGSASVPSEDCFSSEEKAWIILNGRHQRQIDQYKQSMQNLPQLLQFPLEVSLTGEDQDPCARQAYCERVKELLGIDIN